MWRLSPNLSACVASGKLILLDEHRDRYFSVPNAALPSTLAWLRANDGSPAPEVLRTLMPGDVASALTNAQHELLAVPAPSNAVSASERSTVSTILGVGITVLSVWVELRTSRLYRLLNRQRSSRRGGKPIADAVLRRRAQHYAAARRWWPIKPNCLLDTLAFDRWIGTPSSVRIVFGVIAHPFEAHCWAQSAQDVLNDSYDRVSRFEPIMTL